MLSSWSPLSRFMLFGVFIMMRDSLHFPPCPPCLCCYDIGLFPHNIVVCLHKLCCYAILSLPDCPFVLLDPCLEGSIDVCCPTFTGDLVYYPTDLLLVGFPFHPHSHLAHGSLCCKDWHDVQWPHQSFNPLTESLDVREYQFLGHLFWGLGEALVHGVN